MPSFVRVRDDASKHEYSISELAVVDGLTVLDEPALDLCGVVIPPKYHRSTTPAVKPASTPDTNARSK